MPSYMEMYTQWCSQVTDTLLLQELHSIADKKDEIYERLFEPLTFGTAGLRGILGAGIHRMNRYTVAQATQGFANYLLSVEEKPTMVVAYDSRIMSKEFAEITACVFAANGISTHLFPELAPTPVLSFAVRHLGCSGGVVITASHNPSSYNGYKAYDQDGCQIGTPTANKILKEICETEIFTQVKSISLPQAMQTGLVTYVDEQLRNSYLDKIYENVVDKEICRISPCRVVYTPLHGSGLSWVVEALHRQGVDDLFLVESQKNPNGNFPTCPYPNPEFPEALAEGLKLCKEVQGDVLLATDPDSDRVGAMVLHQGEYALLTGNQVGELMLEYLCQRRKDLGRFPQNPIFVKSVVSSKLADAIAQYHGVTVFSVLTGFKNVGTCMKELERENRLQEFLFAFEESCGYLSTTICRDKDAVNACSLLAEMVSYYKSQKQTLQDVLESLYQRHGYYLAKSVSFGFEGTKGHATMERLLKQLRLEPPKHLGKAKVMQFIDYMNHPTLATNMLEFVLEENIVVLVRPSGTEPKIKFYISVLQPTPQLRDSTYHSILIAIQSLIKSLEC